MPALTKCPCCGQLTDDKKAKKWRHVDDVDTETLQLWDDGACEVYTLHRPHDLVERARVVKPGDQLLLIDCTTTSNNKTLFDITNVVSSEPAKQGNTGKIFVVKLKRAEEQPGKDN